ncbi:GDSL esterase/lipase 6 [Humulus lupulus]|uniref:GDSL esterase/lipase 6 n=1 Tax=Humulus lupulus TaxID=3486 RepID=UPI002B412ECE|nr:GDSL esterase/lipase 6 [Humulus lupulus]
MDQKKLCNSSFVPSLPLLVLLLLLCILMTNNPSSFGLASKSNNNNNNNNNNNSDLLASTMFSFGDSILDAGNNHFNQNCSAQADFPPYGSTFFHRPTGRFTNGRTVIDFISEYIGIDFQKPFLEAQMAVSNGSWKAYPSNGINFASAGSGVLEDTNKYFGVTPLQVQLQQFKTLLRQNHTDEKSIKKSLFFMESGSNDIYGYFLSIDNSSQKPEVYVQAMLTEVSKFVEELYKLGARRIGLFSLGPVGCVPARVLIGGPAHKCYGKMNKMVKDYNKGLESLVKDIPVKYSGMVAIYGSVYDVVQRFRTAPSRYGFTNVSEACCGGGVLRGEVQCGREGYKMCGKADEYLFWDYFHPTQHAYKIISKALWTGSTARIRPVNIKTLAYMTLSAPPSIN